MNPIQQSILDKIIEHNTIIIHTHQNPDPDALGSQGGLQHAIQHTFPEKNVFSVGEQSTSLSFLHIPDTITEDVYQDALVIAVDTANTARISDPRFDLGSYLIKIDHHPDMEPYGDLNWTDPAYSSASEMITELLTASEQFQLNDQAARLLYAGIIGDTGRFLYNNTTEKTFQMAQRLVAFNFSPTDIYNNLYEKSLQVARFEGYILQEFDVTANGVAHVYVSEELRERYRVTQEEASNCVNVMANIHGNRVWVLFLESETGTRVRIRSKETPIHQVARQFNGGGHPLASGATVTSDAERAELLTELDDLLANTN